MHFNVYFYRLIYNKANKAKGSYYFLFLKQVVFTVWEIISSISCNIIEAMIIMIFHF